MASYLWCVIDRDDVNSDGLIDIADGIWIIGEIYYGGPLSTCADAADVNDDGEKDLSDAIYTFSYQFLGRQQPIAPFPQCGIDPTIDDLDCQEYPACE